MQANKPGQQGQTPPGRKSGQQGDESGQTGQREQAAPGGPNQQGRKDINPSQQRDDARDDDGVSRRPAGDNDY